ncbi:MAG: hypothetical protein R3D03_04595 [Geminicoccaceae bacterium]
MLELACREIGDGAKADMRMRAHVHTLAGDELRRSAWSKKVDGPTICLAGEGRARRTSRKLPRSRDRGTSSVSMLVPPASSGAGRLQVGTQLMP